MHAVRNAVFSVELRRTFPRGRQNSESEFRVDFYNLAKCTSHRRIRLANLVIALNATTHLCKNYFIFPWK